MNSLIIMCLLKSDFLLFQQIFLQLFCFRKTWYKFNANLPTFKNN